MYDTELLPHAQIKKLILDAGIKRVSNDSVKELEKVLVSYGTTISKEAKIVTNENKRKTVRVEDMALAISNVISKI
jgi:histone H3/H4